MTILYNIVAILHTENNQNEKSNNTEIKVSFLPQLATRVGLQRQNCYSHFWIFGKFHCRLLTVVLINFEFFKNIRNIIICILNSLKMEILKNKKISLTPPSVSLIRVQLRAVLACAESDSVQCQPILDMLTFQFSTPSGLTKPRVTDFANIFAKTNF